MDQSGKDKWSLRGTGSSWTIKNKAFFDTGKLFFCANAAPSPLHSVGPGSRIQLLPAVPTQKEWWWCNSSEQILVHVMAGDIIIFWQATSIASVGFHWKLEQLTVVSTCKKNKWLVPRQGSVIIGFICVCCHLLNGKLDSQIGQRKKGCEVRIEEWKCNIFYVTENRIWIGINLGFQDHKQRNTGKGKPWQKEMKLAGTKWPNMLLL